MSGDVFRLRSLRNYYVDGRSWDEFTPDNVHDRRLKPEEKQVFVVVVLGREPLIPHGNRLDPEKALNDMGWGRLPFPPPEENSP